MKMEVGILIGLLTFAMCPGLSAQSDSQQYVLQKEIDIPIGQSAGKVNVEYLVFGQYVRLPDAIAVDSKGDFIIGSRLQNATIQKFDGNGRLLSVVATRGCSDNNVNYPYKLAIDSSNAIYVLDAYRCVPGESNTVTGSFAIRKFDSSGSLVYDLGYDDLAANTSAKSNIDAFRVTPDGNVYFHDIYDSKTESPGLGSYKTIVATFGVDRDGRFVGKVDDNLYGGYNGQMVRIAVSVNSSNTYDYSITQYSVPAGKSRARPIITNHSELSTVRSLDIVNSSDFLEFMGFDKNGDMFFDKKWEYRRRGNAIIARVGHTVYKYSCQDRLVAKIELPESRLRLIDSMGNVYGVDVVYATAKHFTEGDHIEIRTWVEAE